MLPNVGLSFSILISFFKVKIFDHNFLDSNFWTVNSQSIEPILNWLKNTLYLQ